MRIGTNILLIYYREAKIVSIPVALSKPFTANTLFFVDESSFIGRGSIRRYRNLEEGAIEE